MGALGSMFGTAGTLSGWSQTLLTHSNIASQALGHTLNLINTAGTAVGTVYNNVSSTISGALDKTGNFLKGRGFVATPTVDPTYVNFMLLTLELQQSTHLNTLEQMVK